MFIFDKNSIMDLNKTNKSIILEVTKEINEEYDCNLSPQEVFEIADSQFVGGKIAYNLGMGFCLSKLGNILRSNFIYMSQNSRLIKKLKDEYNLSDAEYKKITKKEREENRKSYNKHYRKKVKDIKRLPPFLSTGVRNISIARLYQDTLNKMRNE